MLREIETVPAQRETKRGIKAAWMVMQRVHRAQPEEGRWRDSFARGCTPTIGMLEQRFGAVPTVPEAAAGVANVDLLRAELAEAEAERDELRGRKRRATTSTHYQTPWDPNADSFNVV